MFLSGIADEAGSAIETQVKAHLELGWSHIEIRNVQGTQLTLVDDHTFEHIYQTVTEAGLTVSCFASGIANWATRITGDPEPVYDELRRAIPRMHRFGTKYIRIMSFPNDNDNPVDEPEWRAEAIKRVRTLVRMAEDGGVVLVHENCSGWGGTSAQNNLDLIEEIASPALKVVFDTGNPVSHGPFDAWEWYRTVYDHIVYVHIKDCVNTDGKVRYTWCGEGDGQVRRIVGDLLARGYNGGFSIEPHIAAIVHTGEQTSSEEAKYNAYIEYGRRLQTLITQLQS